MIQKTTLSNYLSPIKCWLTQSAADSGVRSRILGAPCLPVAAYTNRYAPMMMNYESNVKYFFEERGYRVEKIAETDMESPDFWVSDASSVYLLELKTKFPSIEELETRKRQLYSGSLHNVHELVIANNTLSGIIKKAHKQLKGTGEENVLRLLWLLSTGHLAEPRMLQFEATLYGTAPIVSSERRGDCFFFYNSDFYRFRDVLDGAIVSTEKELKLLLNPLSPRFERMKSSSLAKTLEAGVINPIDLEAQGHAFLVDGEVDRGDKEAVLQYLRSKYKSEDLMNITMRYLSGTMAFPDEGENKGV